MSTANVPPPDRKLPAKKRWLFRAAAVALGLSVFALFELMCVALGWGRPDEFDDPFVGFSRMHSLFVRDTDGQNYVTAKSRREFFAVDTFPVKKPADEFRIFCLGGSTVHGRPYSIPTSFGTWLQLSLTAGDDSRGWRVVNCGGISYASYRLTPILQECLRYEPDLFVICTGHNEFLEERTYGDVKHTAAAWRETQHAVSRLRTFTLLRAGVRRMLGRSSGSTARHRMPAEVDALLDRFNNGLKDYRRDDEFRDAVATHFEINLRRMISAADEAGVPCVLILPPSNLADSPPFKSEHKAGMTDVERGRFDDLVARAKSRYRDDLEGAARLLGEALTIDDRHAATHYELGKVYEALNRRAEARRHLLRARDEDVCPLRMISPLEVALRRVARETDTPLIDAHALLEAKATGGILGDFLLVDHVHPSPRTGHQLIADALAAQLQRMDEFRPTAGWPDRKRARWKGHFGSLTDTYFLHGGRELDALKKWARGRAGPNLVE